MSSAYILQQAAAFGPGRLVNVLRDFGIPVQLRRLYSNDEIPTDLDEIRILVVLGGPMRVTDIASTHLTFLQAELDLLKRAIAVDRPVLGIGLGAQLLAMAAGAKVYPNARPPAADAPPGTPPTPLPEFGWGPVTFPFPGGTEPIVMGLMDGAEMFHWHYDTFDLPRLPAPINPLPPGTPPPPTGNALLSSSKVCKHQAFRFKNRLFGFQYHFELTEADIDLIVAQGKEELAKVVGSDAAVKIHQDTVKNYTRYARLGDRLMKNFVQFTKTY
ncbi:MAG TPA: gamma-glutamyl-gamma-aminobutyrate hydrolase family protein [Tepidisphaeraceae bacterium]|nr:gamma-glutamyl-gamma-aminobutyrate hydrolase family protein [Tepidisphaeraceae bacterium]